MDNKPNKYGIYLSVIQVKVYILIKYALVVLHF